MSDQIEETRIDKVNKEDEIDLLDIIGTLWKRKWLIIIITLLGAVGSVVFSLISLRLPPDRSPLPNVYEPQALVMINESSGSSLSSMLSQSGLGDIASLVGLSSGGGMSYGKLAEKLATTNTLLDILVDEFDIVNRYKIEKYVKTTARNSLREAIKLEIDSATGTMTVSFEHTDPEFATAIVNRVVELLEKRFATIGGNKNLTKMNLLEEKMTEVELEIKRLEAEIQGYQATYGTLDIETLATEQVTMFAELRSKLILKEMEIKSYSDFARVDDPVLTRLKNEQANYIKLLKEMETGYSEYNRVMPPQQELSKIAFEFERLKRELDVQVQILSLLKQQYEVTKLTREGDDPIFQVLELAEVPEVKSGPSRKIIVMVATVAAFFLSVFLAFMANAVRNIKNDPERLKKLKGN